MPMVSSSMSITFDRIYKLIVKTCVLMVWRGHGQFKNKALFQGQELNLPTKKVWQEGHDTIKTI